jgi:hypothetical protein
MRIIYTNINDSTIKMSNEHTVDDDDDVYLNKLQTKGVKKSILYMCNVDQPTRHK